MEGRQEAIQHNEELLEWLAPYLCPLAEVVGEPVVDFPPSLDSRFEQPRSLSGLVVLERIAVR